MRFLERLLDVLSPAVLTPLDDRRRGDRSTSYRGDVERVLAFPADRLREHQLARLREVAAYAARHTRHYASVFAEAGVGDPSRLTWDDFARLPFLTREIMRDRPEALRSDACPEEECVASASGGTLQSPVAFWLDREANARRWAVMRALDCRLGYRPGLKMAYLWGAHQDWPMTSSLKERLRSALITRRRFYPTELLDDAILETYARDLAAFRPRLLQAYPTPLAILAEYLLRRGLRPRVGAITCSAEPLMPEQRETIRAAFGVDPIDWYGARESGRIATECARRDGLHINAYGLIVEVVPVPGMLDPGLGEIVLTDLWNRAFPIIRYRIGDIARWDPTPCACGEATPRLRDLVGRTADVFVNSRGQRIPGVIFPFRLVSEGSRIRALQLLQHAPARFEALVVPGPAYDDATPAWLRERLAAFMNDVIELEVRLVADIPLEPSGKARVAKNLIPRTP